MSKKGKLLKRFLAVPIRSDLTFNELKTLLTSLGFEIQEGKGSRVKFFHPEKKIIIRTHKPHPTPELCKEFIRDLQQVLDVFN
jgi:predicted RNA binding protein YcfA (HicA-like mRNA interferase family)